APAARFSGDSPPLPHGSRPAGSPRFPTQSAPRPRSPEQPPAGAGAPRDRRVRAWTDRAGRCPAGARARSRSPPRRRPLPRRRESRAARAARPAPRASAGGRRRRAFSGPYERYRQGGRCRKEGMRTARATYLAWVRDEVLLVALLAAALAFFLA